MSLKILLSGAKGRMGKAIQSIANEHDCEISFPVDIGDNAEDGIQHCDVVIDFSLRDATRSLAELAKQYNKPLVIGTTGHEKDERRAIEQLTSSIPIVWAGNFSTGVNLLFFLTQQALEILKESRSASDTDIIHGREGMPGERKTSEIGSHALRGGDVVGEHTVMFAGTGERIELTHRATDRVIFAAGALKAAKWVRNQPANLYSMQDVLGLTA